MVMIIAKILFFFKIWGVGAEGGGDRRREILVSGDSTNYLSKSPIQ